MMIPVRTVCLLDNHAQDVAEVLEELECKVEVAALISFLMGLDGSPGARDEA